MAIDMSNGQAELGRFLSVSTHLRARDTRFQQEGIDFFEPDSLLVGPASGLDFDAARLSPEVGLHVLLGRNNAGKTRMLKAIASSKFKRTFKIDELPESWRHEVFRVSSPDGLPRFEATWDRSIDPALLSTNAATQLGNQRRRHLQVQVAKSDQDFLRTRSFSQGFDLTLFESIWSHIRVRPVAPIPTNRYVSDEGPLTSTGEVSNLGVFAPMLENLKRDLNTEIVYQGIASAFAEVTDGLELDFRGTGGSSIIYVREQGRQPVRLANCGDGLRDLVAILAYVAIYSGYDLCLDEPGLRLHPHAQRKLLRHLEMHAKQRAIWIASHDGVFVGSPAVRSRYSVQREVERNLSVVRELPTQIELRRAFSSLGWAPQDALLADRVLYCEGPADKTIFEAAVQHLAEQDASLGGTVVVELGGEGAVWGRKPQVLESIDFLRRVAPHAQHVILLDVGDHGRAAEGLKQWLENRGALVCFLVRNELENYFLEPALVAAVCERAAREWLGAEAVANIRLPSIEELSQRLAGLDIKGDKGSSVLDDVFNEFIRRAYKKTDGATWVAPIWYSQAPTLANELTQEIRDALLAVRS
ncbi:AAA family ATPase [Pyxidicoccus parkwayensis]|uniref:AAA family ATPase n=1 Tax=Pyxidicoccus parkwayensis TaxID=2813578 RepID=A0ABX7NYY8_9BACT|nr:AAA family ATPase [Pyxidicoccus parkwaysis]QSQ23683.1 AAA family ATPase [Pyxidicoccus parkwaysis]